MILAKCGKNSRKDFAPSEADEIIAELERVRQDQEEIKTAKPELEQGMADFAQGVERVQVMSECSY